MISDLYVMSLHVEGTGMKTTPAIALSESIELSSLEQSQHQQRITNVHLLLLSRSHTTRPSAVSLFPAIPQSGDDAIRQRFYYIPTHPSYTVLLSTQPLKHATVEETQSLLWTFFLPESKQSSRSHFRYSFKAHRIQVIYSFTIIFTLNYRILTTVLKTDLAGKIASHKYVRY